MSTHTLTHYLTALHTIRDSGKATTERSYYPALASLFEALGATLTPRVVPVMEVAGAAGEGHPDFVLQIADASADVRAAVEVKGAEADLDSLIGSEQVARYLRTNGLCLVTNLREFALTQRGGDGRTETVMRLSLAEDAAAFWFTPARTLGGRYGARFDDILTAALTWGAPINRPRELAEALARYAREALRRLEQQPAEMLTPLKTALNRALGLHFDDAAGEHFFRSSLVQTLFYGLFSAWVASQGRGGGTFRWREASDYLGLPLLAELFDEIAKPTQLRELDIRETVEWAEATLNRTAWDNFARTFAEGGAVNYFYEPFLQAFDPELRQQLGVWYTPPEIVRYQVARVDSALRDELNIPDGLADPRVVVLDPCCGTGAYLVETLRCIAGRLRDKHGEGLAGGLLRQAALSRVFGFEIMPAPFVVAHLQIGALLASLNAKPSGAARPGVYLTNALTGWFEQSVDTPLSDEFPQLKREAAESLKVKREAAILVILGNPPYYGFAGVAVEEERQLTSAYRAAKRAPQPQGQGLNDLYVRFFRMAERRIVDGTGQGVVCFISNYSWLDGLSHTAMRERYLDVFDRIWIDCLNGDKYRTGKLTPDGKPDPSIFSTESNREGIQVGTAIATLVRRETHTGTDSIEFRHFWGVNKRADLLAGNGEPYHTVTPVLGIGLPYAPAMLGADYLSWPRLPELFPRSFPGVKTSRDDVVVDVDKDRLMRRMEQYFDPAISHEQMRQIAPGAMEDGARFPAQRTREQLVKRGFLPQNIVPYCYRPFDVRWLYWEPETKLLDEKRADYVQHAYHGNVWMSAGQRNRKADLYQPQVMTVLADHHIVESNVALFPLRLKAEHAPLGSAFDATWNLSETARTYLSGLDAPLEWLFYHAVAMMHAPEYRVENAGALRQDWPRIPLPASREALEASAALGRQLAALLDPETPVAGVTTGPIRDDLRGVAVLMRVGGGALAEDEYRVTAGWGHPGQGGVTMPGRGLVKANGEALDVYLNERAYWSNVPARVWEYTLGGYQVIKKWLSYREYRMLGRALLPEEAAEVTAIARRIAAILVLEPTLDTNYAAVKAE